MSATRVPPPPHALRPVISVAWPALGVLVTAVAVPVVILGALHSLVDRRARLFRVSILVVLLMWADIRMLLRCRRLPDQPAAGEEEAWRRAHERVLGQTLDEMMVLARRWVGFEVRLTDRMRFGADATPLIAFARHAGPGDSLALAWLLAGTAHRLPRIVLAEALRWDPGVSTLLTRLDSYFVPSRTGAGDDKVRGVTQLAGSLRPEDVLLLFPEGQNWSPARQLRLIESLRAKGADLRAWRAARLRNVLPPRTGGVVAALTARPDADVMIVAHAGFGRLTTVRQIWEAVPFTDRPFLVKTWTYAARTLPDDAAGIARWLEEHWSEIDEWVEEQYRVEEPGG